MKIALIDRRGPCLSQPLREAASYARSSSRRRRRLEYLHTTQGPLSRRVLFLLPPPRNGGATPAKTTGGGEDLACSRLLYAACYRLVRVLRGRLGRRSPFSVR